MPKNETDNFITKCKQIFTPEVNVTELCQKYKLKADGIYLLHRDKQGSVFQEQMITHKPLLITGFFHEAEADITYVQLELYHAQAWHKKHWRRFHVLIRLLRLPIIMLISISVTPDR